MNGKIGESPGYPRAAERGLKGIKSFLVSRAGRPFFKKELLSRLSAVVLALEFRPFEPNWRA
jgi:hypothetical protein